MKKIEVLNLIHEQMQNHVVEWFIVETSLGFRIYHSEKNKSVLTSVDLLAVNEVFPFGTFYVSSLLGGCYIVIICDC